MPSIGELKFAKSSNIYIRKSRNIYEENIYPIFFQRSCSGFGAATFEFRMNKCFDSQYQDHFRNLFLSLLKHLLIDSNSNSYPVGIVFSYSFEQWSLDGAIFERLALLNTEFHYLQYFCRFLKYTWLTWATFKIYWAK